MELVLLYGIIDHSRYVPPMAYRKFKTRIRTPARRVAAGGGFLFVAFLSAWLWAPAAPEPEAERHPSTGISLPLMNARVALPGAALSRQARPAKMVYRNSVLPGGVGSAAELTSALAHDPVAAAHYAGFQVAAARAVRVERPTMAHVSYRIGDKIYWTRKPVRLALGETLLSDGEHLVRARCGNRISEQAQAPVLVNEPAPEVLEMAFISAESLIDAPPDVAPRANDAVATEPAGAQPATSTRGVPSFAFSPDFGFWSPPAIHSPTQILALSTPPVSGIGGDSAPVREPTPSPTPTTTPTKTPPPPGTPDAPPPTFPPPDSPPPKSPPEKSPPEKSPAPESPPITPQPGPNPGLTLPRAPTPVPEPGSAALFGLGLAIFVLTRARATRRRSKSPSC